MKNLEKSQENFASYQIRKEAGDQVGLKKLKIC